MPSIEKGHGRAYTHSRHQGVWIMPPPGVCLCLQWGWESRKGSRSTQDGHHPPHEEQSLAEGATWVSAHAVDKCLLPLAPGLVPRDSSATRGHPVGFSQSAHSTLCAGPHMPLFLVKAGNGVWWPHLQQPQSWGLEQLP